ncbi:MAG: phosphotyrosine protein phosphatase [Ilumatobacteraceae bacterium]|nr:phosphotyrosine protein phosphatase [Ilumatobacteraceae bacterium]MCU1389596.1 phosphotyrosine protein phosphatase [Ilumatobacteraceae bacterium]
MSQVDATSATGGAQVLFVCTGNATRSVIGGEVLQRLRPDLVVTTAGTLVVEGLPMSFRTRAGFAAIGFPAPDHRSRQATAQVIATCDLIVAMAPEHVRWVRREHPFAAAKTATLKRLCRDLAASDRPLAERVRALELGTVELDNWEEVLDPGGGEVERFIECAIEIDSLIERFASIL